MKYLNILIVFLLFSCSSLPSQDYYKLNHKKLYSKNNKNDTIYIYFKHGKFEKFKSYKFSKPKFKYQNNYVFSFPKIKIGVHSNLYFSFVNFSHIYKNGIKVENKILEKDKKFLKVKKKKVYSYKDFKRLNSIEISYFYSYNQFKTVYLIDKKENNNNKIYLRQVSFGSNFPKIQ